MLIILCKIIVIHSIVNMVIQIPSVEHSCCLFKSCAEIASISVWHICFT